MVIFHTYVSLPEGIYKNVPYNNKKCPQPTSHLWVVGFAPTGLIPERGVGCHGHQSLGDRPQSLHLATLASFYHVLLILDHIDLCIVSNPFWKWYDLHSLSLSQPHRTISNHHVWSKSRFLGWKSTMCFVKLQFFMLKSTSPHLWFFLNLHIFSWWNHVRSSFLPVKKNTCQIHDFWQVMCPTWRLPIQKQRCGGINIAGVDDSTTGVNQGRGQGRFHVWMLLQVSVQRLARPRNMEINHFKSCV